MKKASACKISKQEIMATIRKIVRKHHGAFVRFTDISKYKRVPGGYIPIELLPDVKSAIVHTIRIKTMFEVYGDDYMAGLSEHLTIVNKEICNYLGALGTEARDIPESAHDKEMLVGDLSFRQLGVLAGLGHIGKNQMLINDQLGSAFNLGVVLSTLRLQSKNTLSRLKCSHCDICLKVCPVNALNKERYDRFTCKKRKKILKRNCGIVCIRNCPLNKDKFEIMV